MSAGKTIAPFDANLLEMKREAKKTFPKLNSSFASIEPNPNNGPHSYPDSALSHVNEEGDQRSIETNKELINRIAMTHPKGIINLDIGAINRLKVEDFGLNDSYRVAASQFGRYYLADEYKIGLFAEKTLSGLSYKGSGGSSSNIRKLIMLNREVEKQNLLLRDKAEMITKSSPKMRSEATNRIDQIGASDWTSFSNFTVPKLHDENLCGPNKQKKQPIRAKVTVSRDQTVGYNKSPAKPHQRIDPQSLTSSLTLEKLARTERGSANRPLFDRVFSSQLSKEVKKSEQTHRSPCSKTSNRADHNKNLVSDLISVENRKKSSSKPKNSVSILKQNLTKKIGHATKTLSQVKSEVRELKKQLQDVKKDVDSSRRTNNSSRKTVQYQSRRQNCK